MSSCTDNLSEEVKTRTTIDHTVHLGGNATFMDKVKANIGILILLSFWVLGSLSPLFILILFLLHYIKLATFLLVLATIPYFAPVPRSNFIQWLVGRGISAHAYFKDGFHCYFMKGAREAIMNHTEQEYLAAKQEKQKLKQSTSGSGGSGASSPSSPNPLDNYKKDRKPVLLSFHPHGIFPFTMYLGGITNPAIYRLNTTITFLISSLLTKAPFWLYILQALGSFGPATKEYILMKMKAKEDIALIPGGFEEASLTEYGKHKIYLKERKGFIKYALQYGYTVVPVYGFGEELNYYNPQFADSVKLWLNKHQIPGVLPIGKFGYLGFSDHEMHAFYGAPLELPHIEEPTVEDLDKWHSIYVERVQELFDAGKQIINTPEATLEIL